MTSAWAGEAVNRGGSAHVVAGDLAPPHESKPVVRYA
jgi:hypothetical protein